jgi:hypothetical protein
MSDGVVYIHYECYGRQRGLEVDYGNSGTDFSALHLARLK